MVEVFLAAATGVLGEETEVVRAVALPVDVSPTILVLIRALRV